jgi:hypothetical protein
VQLDLIYWAVSPAPSGQSCQMLCSSHGRVCFCDLLCFTVLCISATVSYCSVITLGIRFALYLVDLPLHPCVDSVNCNFYSHINVGIKTFKFIKKKEKLAEILIKIEFKLGTGGSHL